VLNVSSGYAGGEIENPSYQQICTGLTGHAEVVQLDFDSSIVSYNTLLEMFFTLHDATQLNRQGNDVGTQYRSVIYYHDEKQKAESQAMIDALQKQIREPIVTELSPLTNFYPAEQYHQDYYNENPNQGYCSILIAPKLAKFEQYYADKLK
jgi:peptide-methionine (S)-S-oxide reductase